MRAGDNRRPLKTEGKGIKTIVRELGLAKETVRRFYRAMSLAAYWVRQTSTEPLPT